MYKCLKGLHTNDLFNKIFHRICAAFLPKLWKFGHKGRLSAYLIRFMEHRNHACIPYSSFTNSNTTCTKCSLAFTKRSLSRQGHGMPWLVFIGSNGPHHYVIASDWRKVPYIATALAVRKTLSFCAIATKHEHDSQAACCFPSPTSTPFSTACFFLFVFLHLYGFEMSV